MQSDQVVAETHAGCSPAEIQGLRARHYNATVAAVLPVHDELTILRVVSDDGLPRFRAGQFFMLRLGNWEPRVAGVDDEHLDATHRRRVSQRAYSASCSIFDEVGQLKQASEFEYLEFYLALVRHSDRRPPALTPRLFALEAGDRLYVSPEGAGHYSVAPVLSESNVFLFATGTGEAPHNAMIAELLSRGHRGQIVSVVSVRWARDAAYRACHKELMRRFPNYHYFLTTTREVVDAQESLVASSSAYMQDLVTSGDLERRTGVPLEPDNTHVFLCGNPAMIGLSPRVVERGYEPGSMLDVLLRRGFQTDEHGRPGNVHFERYW